MPDRADPPPENEPTASPDDGQPDDGQPDDAQPDDAQPEARRAAHEPVASPSVRAQLLATEHWGLLAARSTTQSEVLTRISMFLTLTSAALVSLALVGQASDFGGIFPSFAVVVLSIVLLVGLLTQLRVMNVMREDLQFVIAMNRLRAAYSELDPGIERYFMESRFDDMAGSRETYYFLGPRGASQILGSSAMFIVAVNSTLLGLLIAAAAGFVTASTALAAVIGGVSGVALLVFSMWRGGRSYFVIWKRHTPMFPTPQTPPTSPAPPTRSAEPPPSPL